MNKHISLVKKWLNDPESVSAKELLDNMNVADRAASKFLRQSASASASARAARGAAVSAYCTSTSAAAAADAARWVKKYEELTNEKAETI